MKIDVSQKIVDFDGKTVEGKTKEEDLTVRDAIMTTLLTPLQDDQGQGGDKGFERFRLAGRVHAAPQFVELTIDEAKIIKDRVGKIYAPLILGRVWEALENPRTDLKVVETGE